MKKPIIPLAIIIILIGLYFMRWEREAPPVAGETVQLQIAHNLDRWTGQLWGDYYLGIKIFEAPVISESNIQQYAETVKLRPEVIKMLQDTPQTANVDNLAKETARIDLTNKAWLIRRALTSTWSVLITLTIIWLLVPLWEKRKTLKQLRQ
ncbi:MAG: hypothetical protein A4E55_01273 [Pelotomaculum sp. PtaU1.Bin035]|nr:MAG: hypothetical protein A4E55_01273 [Pelotomaculum sp. PtaU1.Bin035]